MLRRPQSMYRSLFLLLALPALFSCGPYFQISRTSEDPPTPVVQGVKGGTETPNVFTDPAAFQIALLNALSARDASKLVAWMTDPFLIGVWRGDQSETSPGDAVKRLFGEELAAEPHFGRLGFAEVKALIGGKDPLSIPRADAGVVNAFLITGWGKDGRDEAILFVARQGDNSLKLNGWMVIQGGFSGARVGGIRLYDNPTQGYQVFLPKSYETDASGNQVSIVAPIEGGEPGVAIVSAEPAKGRTTEQVASQIVKAAQAQLGPGANIKSTSIKIESAQAVVVTGLPGQDLNRQLFMVRGDLLYHILFIPDNPGAGKAYEQMQDLYAMIINTFHFTK